LAGIKSLAGQTLIYGLGTIVPRLVNYLLLVPFYTRVFDKGAFGSYTILYSYVAFFIVFLTYGMETTFFKFSSTEKHTDKVFSTGFISLLLTSLPFLVLVLFFNQEAANWMKFEHNPNFVLWLGLIVVLDAVFAIPFAKLRQENRAKRFTSIKLINVAVNIGLNFLFLYFFKNAFENNPDSFMGSLYRPEIGEGYILIANLAASALSAALLIPEFFKIKWSFNWELWKRMMGYALPLLVVGLAAMINEVADKLFLQRLIPDSQVALEQVGEYGANYKLAVLMTIFIQMFKYAAEPFFFKQAKESNAKETYAKVMNFFVIFGISIFLGVTLFIDWFKIYIDSNYYGGLKIVPIVLIANLFLGMYYNLSVWYKLTNKTHLGALISITGAILTISVNFIFIPEFGYMASAWATLGAYGLMMILSWIWGQKHYPIKYNIPRIIFYFGIAALIYFSFSAIEFSNAWTQNIVALLYCAAFGLIAFITERKELKSIM
jgi:O-antigen/teichoic acid export membrane protein